MSDLQRLVETLCAASRADGRSPYEDLPWPEAIDEDAWCFSPELISLRATETYAGLDERQRRRLSLYEAANFFSLNVHGERTLVEGLARRLYRKESEVTTPYLHHFLDEENTHMVYFGTFCTRYAGKVYPERKVAFPREYEPGEEDFLFFAKVLVFEEIVDVYNRRMAKDGRLHPLVREINRLHHRDESRHLAFGRQLVKELFDRHARTWSSGTLSGLRAYIADYVVATWREYYNPSVYRDCGLPDPHALLEDAFGATESRRVREEITESWAGMLVRAGILEEVPRT